MPAATTQLVDAYDDPFPPQMLRPSASTQSFRASNRGRLNGGTRGPIGSANSHRDARTLENLIRESEAQARNNHLMRALMTARSDYIVGDNPGLEARSEDDDWNTEVEERFREWCSTSCDNSGQLTLAQTAGSVVNAFDTSGGVLIHKVVGPGSRPRLEIIEAIRLQNPNRKADTKFMHAGVELSEVTNRPIKYHVADWNRQGKSLTSQTRPIDATNAWLINNPRLLGANQHRAEPFFSSIIDRLETIERAAESTWGAYEMATYFALFISRQAAAGTSIEESMAQAAVAAGMDRNTTDAISRGAWNPLAILEGRVGEKIEQVKPEHPTTGFDKMFWTELAGIAAAVDLPLELGFIRFTNNFAASRSAISVAWKKIKVSQQCITSKVLSPVYLWWLACELHAGRIGDPKAGSWKAHEWFMPTMPSLDPKAETEARLMKLSGGLTLHETELRESGQGDRKQFLRKYKREQEENAEAGLTYGQPVQITRSEQVDPYELENEEQHA